MKFAWLYSLMFLLLPAIGLSQSVTLSKQFVKLASSNPNVPSAPDTVLVSFQSFNANPTLVTASPFEISVDGINYSDTINYQNPIGAVPLYIRSVFPAIDLSDRGRIQILDNNFILNDKIYLLGSSIPAAQTISMCTWNIKWFGLPSKCSCDTAVARDNVTQILKELDADIYALQEIVDVDMLQLVVTDLGPDYDYAISDYCSQIQSSSTTGYSTCQKLAYIYNKSKLNNVGQFGLLKSTYPGQQGNSSPYYYFASGRWPFAISVVPKNSLDTLRLINIHAKAFTGSTEHNRRAGGALKMTDSLNVLFPNNKIVVLGDYNDKIEGANTAGFTLSPYDYMFTNGFVGITKPSLYPGQKTYASSFGNIIDNYVLSNTAYNDYIPNSTFIFEEVDDAFTNFSSTTTDHYPVLSHIRINQSTDVRELDSKSNIVLVQPNGKELLVKFGTKQPSAAQVYIYSIDGRRVFNKRYNLNNIIREDLSYLESGIYIVSIYVDGQMESKKWIIH